jgi:RES domain
VFREMGVIPDIELLARRISVIHVPTPVRLADCTSPAAASFGVTAAIHSSEDYVNTQTWAGALAAAGFGGVRYLVSHDPAQRNVGVALFGSAGAGSLPVHSTDLISPRLISAAERIFGYRVIPLPGR